MWYDSDLSSGAASRNLARDNDGFGYTLGRSAATTATAASYVTWNVERRRIVTLLPDRETATVEAWLADYPGITIVARDRGGGYGEATAKALSDAVQVADRWHLMENASAAFLDAVRKSMRAIRTAIGTGKVDPELLTCTERLQYEGFLRREETNAAVMKLAAGGIPIKEIVCRIGHSRKLVRQIVRGERTDAFRVRQNSLDAHLPFLDEQWALGCRNGAELWRRLKARGFRGALRVVAEWATRRRRAEQASDQLRKVPSARTVARSMTMARDHLSKADTVIIAADFEPWIAEVSVSLIASFASGIARDKAAVRAAIIEPWSNGQTEGQITKLKLVKRQIYGRGKIDLLQVRLIGAA
ncbi:hypothetical protein ATN84_21490 [Paramesorhizobium deserti]|uniref:Transposase IS204/IS1001/IS1096/IS1165 DDE domain-containing protein n=1 Tax=Paramesorhizobium deserti TaxID=1494590 RepID=A0A135HNN5_9HYPH|nr:hypothetical protein ATN84_21490 [Paramesorhizobium deserti]